MDRTINTARRPTHPGAILREDTLPAIRLSGNELAEAIDISQQILKEILKERGSVSADIAHRLGRAFGMSPDIWLRMQQAVDLYALQEADNANLRKD